MHERFRKIAVFAVIFLAASLMIPHVQLVGFINAGVGAASAQTGDNCNAPYQSYQCYDKNTETCPSGTSFKAGYCPGGTNIQCCAPTDDTSDTATNPACGSNNEGNCYIVACPTTLSSISGTCESGEVCCGQKPASDYLLCSSCTEKNLIWCTANSDPNEYTGQCAASGPCPSYYPIMVSSKSQCTTTEAKNPHDFVTCSSCTPNYKWCTTEPPSETTGSCEFTSTDCKTLISKPFAVTQPAFCPGSSTTGTARCSQCAGTWCNALGDLTGNVGYCSPTTICQTGYVKISDNIIDDKSNVKKFCPGSISCVTCANFKKKWCTLSALNDTVGYCINDNENCPAQFSNAITKDDGTGCFGSTQSDSRHLRCSQECNNRIGTSGSLAVGYCSPTQAIPNDRSIPNSVGTLSTPIAISGDYCGTPVQGQPKDTCWCIKITPASDFQLPTIPIDTSTPTVGSTPTSWDDPEKLMDAPEYPANTHACESNITATLKGSLSSTTVQKGDSITVNVEVGKSSTACVGFKYECRTQRIMTCDVSNGVFKAETKAKPCPQTTNGIDWVSLHVEGEESKFKWGNVFAIGALVASAIVLFLPIIPGSQAAAVAIFKDISHLFITASGVFNSLYDSTFPSCFRVCGYDFQQKAVTSSPQCQISGGAAGYATDATAATYKCTPSADACGPYAGQQVNVQLRDPYGKSYGDVKSKITDENGMASIAFDINGASGKYSAFITVS